MNNAVLYRAFAGWCVTAITILVVALLLVSEESRSAYFWYRLAWTQVLCLFVWAGIFLYLFAALRPSERLGAIAPTIAIIVLTYASISFLLMLVDAVQSEAGRTSRAHLILQIILLSAVSLGVILLSISRIFSIAGFEPGNKNEFTLRELQDRLYAREVSLNGPAQNGLQASVKQLRETLLYSLSESSTLSQRSEFQELGREIVAFCDSMAECLQSGASDDLNRCKVLQELGVELAKKTRMVASQIVKR